MKKSLICLSCPVGCRLEAVPDGKNDWEVSGNQCPRGVVYARNELTDPRRIVTAVVRSDSELLPFIPVRTDRPLPRRMAARLLNELYRMQIKTPVKCGEVLIKDFDQTGVNIVFSSNSNN
jgi:CxxC motif-containing protein